MENRDPKNLLEKFYEGCTSTQEEQFLYNYLRNNIVPVDLEKDRKIFLDLYTMDEEIEIPPNLEKDLNLLIDQLERKETRTKIINWRWVGGIAASIMIIFSCSLYMFRERNSNQVLTDTYSNPTEAYIATQKALLLASNKLNKGCDQLQDAQNNLDKTNKVINKIFQQ